MAAMDASVASYQDKLAVAVLRSRHFMTPELGEAFGAIFSPINVGAVVLGIILAVIGGPIVAWLLGAAGVCVVGSSLGQQLMAFSDAVTRARSDPEINEAARQFAAIVDQIGLASFLAALGALLGRGRAILTSRGKTVVVAEEIAPVRIELQKELAATLREVAQLESAAAPGVAPTTAKAPTAWRRSDLSPVPSASPPGRPLPWEDAGAANYLPPPARTAAERSGQTHAMGGLRNSPDSGYVLNREWVPYTNPERAWISYVEGLLTRLEQAYQEGYRLVRELEQRPPGDIERLYLAVRRQLTKQGVPVGDASWSDELLAGITTSDWGGLRWGARRGVSGLFQHNIEGAPRVLVERGMRGPATRLKTLLHEAYHYRQHVQSQRTGSPGYPVRGQAGIGPFPHGRVEDAAQRLRDCMVELPAVLWANIQLRRLLAGQSLFEVRGFGLRPTP